MVRTEAETNGRCAAAALNMLRREFDQLDCSPTQRRRLEGMADMAREHINGILSGPAVPSMSSPEIEWEAETCGIEDQAVAAWKHAYALRQSLSPMAGDMHREHLASLAATTTNVRVRRICREALVADR